VPEQLVKPYWMFALLSTTLLPTNRPITLPPTNPDDVNSVYARVVSTRVGPTTTERTAYYPRESPSPSVVAMRLMRSMAA